MTLRLVHTEQVDHGVHSVRVRTLSDDHTADLEFLARNVLAPGLTACRELADAMARHDRDGAIAACRRMLATGLIARERASQMERER